MRTAISVLMLTFVTAVGLAFFIAPQLASMTERLKTVFPNQPLLVHSTWINDTCIAITVQNTATVNVEITQITINNEPYATSSFVISPKELRTLHLYGTYKRGEEYTVVITSSFGKPLTIILKYD
ncbi:hypothetical protein DRO50_02065 [Candidatus Bathyarchaeota archaeon]|nr:MAG: hypothetical protein DRO50_02065 [Candidatus Bathyarchaeota archaeon]